MPDESVKLFLLKTKRKRTVPLQLWGRQKFLILRKWSILESYQRQDGCAQICKTKAYEL